MIATKTPSVEAFLQTGENERSEYAQAKNGKSLRRIRSTPVFKCALAWRKRNRVTKLETGRLSPDGIIASVRKTTPNLRPRHRVCPRGEARRASRLGGPRFRRHDRDRFSVRIGVPLDGQGRILSSKRRAERVGSRPGSPPHRSIRAEPACVRISRERYADRPGSSRLCASSWFRGVALKGWDLTCNLAKFWGAEKRLLCGRVAAIPREFY
jgi:hypothetical protein